MTVVVTGAAGFVGRFLVERLIAQGAHVVAVDTRADGLPHSSSLETIVGDLSDPACRRAALASGCSALVHLATVPGGAAEADPQASRRVNLDGMYDLLLEAGAGSFPRVVYASSIAVLGGALPAEGVNDATELSPTLIYGGHKAMMEVALAMFSNRGMLDGVGVRLPGILARPLGPSGMKSAFMSDLFHALRAGRAFTCPVSPDATIWAQSLECCVDNLLHGLSLDSTLLPRSRTVTLPALTIRMADLADETARQCGAAAGLVSFDPDPALEAMFGAYPPLSTPAAERAGFRSDGSLADLVRRALAHLERVG